MATITSRSNPRLQQLRAAFGGNRRLADGLVAIEGRHLVEEALRSGVALQTVFAAAGLREAPPLPAGVELLRVAGEVLAGALETRTPQGLAALLRPPASSLDQMLRGEPLLLVAVGLQDPGNLGTLIRSAEAFGATGVLTTPGTVSAWNGKCVRASAGSVFRMPLAEADLGIADLGIADLGIADLGIADLGTADLGTMELGTLDRLRGAGVRLLAAVREGGQHAAKARLDRSCALLIGNEGAGLPDEWLRAADACISIPCPGPVESLNAAVAGSLLLYEASRQRVRG